MNTIGTWLRDPINGIYGHRRGKQEDSWVSTRFSLSLEKKRTDVGRDGRTRLARPNVRARTRTGPQITFSVELHHEQDSL